MALTKTKVKAKRAKSSVMDSRKNVPRPEIDLLGRHPELVANDLAEDSDSSEASRDDTEKALEKLIFGDDEGFLESLKARSSAKGKELILGRDSSEELQDAPMENDLGAVDDADLFFLDAGPGNISAGISASLATSKSETIDHEEVQQRATWWDSDDDRIVVSLASNPRLRKLRDTEAEDVVGGRDYIQRLRRQYERLHPRPSWANAEDSNTTNPRKRRRRDSEGSSNASDSDGEAESDEEMSSIRTQPLAALLRSTDSLIDTSAASKSMRFKLRPEVIDIHKLKDVTSSSPSAITALSFHERYPILLATAGPASTVFLHHVSPHSLNPNPLLTSLLLKRTPLYTVEFRPSRSDNMAVKPEDDTEIFLSSRRRFMHTWQLSSGRITRHTRPIYGNKAARASQRTLESFHLSPCGRYVAFVGSSRKGGGIINVLDASTMQWLCACRVDGRGGLADFAWWGDGNGMAVLSKSGEVSEFSIQERRVLARWTDEGNIGPTTIIIGGKSGKPGGLLGSDRWVVTGSTSGFVNIYNRSTWGHSPVEATASQTQDLESNAYTPAKPSPTRALDQLTTPVSSLTLSPDGQVLAIASRWKRDALRLIHLPSCTVYRNWPTSSTPLGRITSVAMTTWGGNRNSEAPDGKGLWLCVGNEKGRVGMWEIRA